MALFFRYQEHSDTKGGKKSKQEVVCNVNVLLKLLHSRQATSHIPIYK